jgi:hypothetical protein
MADSQEEYPRDKPLRPPVYPPVWSRVLLRVPLAFASVGFLGLAIGEIAANSAYKATAGIVTTAGQVAHIVPAIAYFFLALAACVAAVVLSTEDEKPDS